jgi:hypothetical protein
MDDATRPGLLRLLGQEMSDISEDCYCAGWLGGTEYFVPEICRRALESGRSQIWGHGEVTPARAKELTLLADQLGCWADLDEDGIGYVPHQPFPVPQQYIEALDREGAWRVGRVRE